MGDSGPLDALLKRMGPETMAGLIPPTLYPEKDEYMDFGKCLEGHAKYYALCCLLQPKSILEIGVYLGHSMIAMLLGAGRRCQAVGWDAQAYKADSNARAAENIAAMDLNWQVVLHASCSQVKNNFGGPYDLIHVDGDHEYHAAMHDLELASESTRVILFDDASNPDCPGCVKAAQDFCEQRKGRIAYSEIIPTRTGLLVVFLYAS